jgi:hypothetical protein
MINQPPYNFKFHDENLVFSAYPDINGIKFLRSLGFRKFINICEIWPRQHEAMLGKEFQLELMHYPLQVGEYSFMPTDTERVIRLIDKIMENKKLGSKTYVYDENGTKKVGLISAILRKIENWHIVDVLDHYEKFAPNEVTTASKRFIYDFDVLKWT